MAAGVKGEYGAGLRPKLWNFILKLNQRKKIYVFSLKI
jgi:hypothetical protein